MKITNNKTPFGLDVKRFYLPVTIEDACPTCGETVVEDLEKQYLSYPAVNKSFELHMGHECPKDADGETEWTVQVILHVTLEAVA